MYLFAPCKASAVLILGYSVFLNKLWTHGEKVDLYHGTSCYVKIYLEGYNDAFYSLVPRSSVLTSHKYA
jgi:hypothetical protein